jgi:hypothetical protein
MLIEKQSGRVNVRREAETIPFDVNDAFKSARIRQDTAKVALKNGTEQCPDMIARYAQRSPLFERVWSGFSPFHRYGFFNTP